LKGFILFERVYFISAYQRTNQIIQPPNKAYAYQMQQKFYDKKLYAAFVELVQAKRHDTQYQQNQIKFLFCH